MSTICAISTSLAEAAIGIVRLSGPDSLKIAKRIFRGGDLEEKPRYLHYGHIYRDQEMIDEVLAVYFKGPKTYTREDMVEINCHGGALALQRVLALCLEEGARLAEAGEFTQRAFLNGRLDLTQAEAVMQLIQAKTDLSYDVGLTQLGGDISRKLGQIREILLELLASISLSIDYPEEDEEEISYERLKEGMTQVEFELERLLENSKKGKLLEEGLRTVISGRPNVGKSTLLNVLSGHSRAIVTDIAGTTRDTIEEKIQIQGLPLILIDTAGLRDTQDPVEYLGVERSHQAMEAADFILYVLSAEDTLEIEDEERLKLLKNREYLVVVNKMDKDINFDIDRLKSLVDEENILFTSLVKDQGIRDIEDAILERTIGKELSLGEPLIQNQRQIGLLNEALSWTQDALRDIEMGQAYDYIEVNIRGVFESLGQVLGENNPDIIGEVFSRFCVGK